MGEQQNEARLKAVRAPLQSPPDRTANTRRLVVDLLRDHSRGTAPSPFLVRRAGILARDIPDRAERGAVAALLSHSEHGLAETDRLLDALLCWAGCLEGQGLFDQSCDVLELARELGPSNAKLALHAARIARKAGRRDRARALYDRVAELHPAAPLGLMAAIGHALLSGTPETELGCVLRAAVEAGDTEAAAVAQHERARARRAAGDIAGALRDYLVAAARYRDPVDVGLIGNEAADMLIMRGDFAGAREALMEITCFGHAEQATHARTRLQGIARVQGDQLGLRRYADAPSPALVSLSPPARLRQGRGARASAAVHRGLARIRKAFGTPAFTTA